MPLRIQLCQFPFTDVNARTNVAEKRAISGEARRPCVQNPAIFPVASAQAVFSGEWLPRVKGICIDCKTSVEVVAVNTIGPPIAELLFQRAAGKVEPALVEKDAEFVCARHPEHDRRGVGHDAKTSLALPQRFFSLLAPRNVA